MDEKRYIGIDWGNTDNHMAVSVFSANGEEVHRELFKGEGWASMRGRLLDLNSQYKPSVILADNNSIGSVNIEALQREGLPIQGFTITKRSKDAVLNHFRGCLEKGEIKLMKPIRFSFDLSELDEMGLAVAYSLWARQYYGGADISFV